MSHRYREIEIEREIGDQPNPPPRHRHRLPPRHRHRLPPPPPPPAKTSWVVYPTTEVSLSLSLSISILKVYHEDRKWWLDGIIHILDLVVGSLVWTSILNRTELSKKNMAPGGGVYRDVAEFPVAFADYGIAPTETEFRNPPFRKSAAGIGGKLGMASNSGVHELLDCPVCLNVKYPPIHQDGKKGRVET